MQRSSGNGIGEGRNMQHSNGTTWSRCFRMGSRGASYLFHNSKCFVRGIRNSHYTLSTRISVKWNRQKKGGAECSPGPAKIGCVWSTGPNWSSAFTQPVSPHMCRRVGGNWTQQSGVRHNRRRWKVRGRWWWYCRERSKSFARSSPTSAPSHETTRSCLSPRLAQARQWPGPFQISSHMLRTCSASRRSYPYGRRRGNGCGDRGTRHRGGTLRRCGQLAPGMSTAP
mmetsp:Transcript_2555/g.5179  ORF Transcript_2555/g.5179 Transcript_2555/m.5179 type:complete len:226 (+) Transcript_2555:6156-6833(+)